MKRFFLFAFFVLAVIGWHASPTTNAQTASSVTQKRQLFSVTVRHVKPELMDEYLNFIKTRMNPLRIKGGTKQSQVWIVGRGPQNTVITASPIENYAHQDQPAGIAKALDADALAVFWQQHAKYLSQQESYLIESLPECSWTSPKFKARPERAEVRLTNLLKAFEVLDWARFNNIKSVCADVNSSSSYLEIDWTNSRLLILGSEGHGLTEIERQATDENLIIPMENAVESLNVAVACGVILFEAKRQRNQLFN